MDVVVTGAVIDTVKVVGIVIVSTSVLVDTLVIEGVSKTVKLSTQSIYNVKLLCS